MKHQGGQLNRNVAFDAPERRPNGYGGIETAWRADAYTARAEFIHVRGGEGVEAARLQGRSVFKIKLRSTANSREITSAWRVREMESDTVFNIREVDTLSDRGWIWILVESGVAT